ncbi:MAG: ABC transporter substrate-binding protein, partial [Actinobacteria bacterium]|nr:ABC transporter substrate-binding protein [Actinomycetota bacterium]
MTHQSMQHPLLLLLVSLALVLPLGACATGDTTEQATPSASPVVDEFPVELDAANGKVTIEARPERIVSLSPTATEMLFAIGAGDQVIAAEENSNYPPEAPETDLSGFEPNVEAIAAYD